MPWLLGVIIAPFILFGIAMTAGTKRNNKNVVYYGIGYRIVMLVGIIIATLFGVLLWIDPNDKDTTILITVLVLVMLSFFVWGFFVIFSFKLEVKEDCFIVRNRIFRKKTYRYDQITGIKWRTNPYSPCYILLIGKKKVELSAQMINFELIDKKLRKEGVFKKVPAYMSTLRF